MALYETIYIARQDMAAEDVDKLTEKFEKLTEEFKGKVISKEYWGLRKFAYKINKSGRGHYVMLNIEAGNEAITELDRVMGLNEDVVRSMILNNPEQKVGGNSELFASKSAKDYKPPKISDKDKKEKKSEGKYDALLKTLNFDN